MTCNAALLHGTGLNIYSENMFDSPPTHPADYAYDFIDLKRALRFKHLRNGKSPICMPMSPEDYKKLTGTEKICLKRHEPKLPRRDDTLPEFRYIRDGIGYPSVTEILKMLSKPDLTAWQDRTPNAEQISRDRATVGTIVHWKIHRYLSSLHSMPIEAFRVDDLTLIRHNISHCKKEDCNLCQRKMEITAAVDTIWSYFEDLVSKHALIPASLEKTVYNPEYGYAGTLDFLGTIDGQPALLDWKTAKMFYNNNTYGAQLSAYNRALQHRVKTMYIGRLNENNGWELREFTDDWETFIKALDMYKEAYPGRIKQKI